MTVTGITAGIGSTDCYIADNGDGSCYIIDAPDHLARLFAMIRERSLEPSGVLLTHAHYDHILGLGEIREEYPGIPVYLAREDEFFIRDGGKGNIQILGRYSPIAERLADLPSDTVPYGNEIGPFSVLRTPGHTPGSVSLYCSSSGVLFSGDTLFAGSAGRWDLGGSYSDLIASLSIIRALPDDTRIFPGHGCCTTVRREKEENPYLF